MGLARLVVSLLELLEEEARALGAGLLDLKIASILAWVAGFLLVAGSALSVAALYFFASRVFSGPAALLFTGLLTILASGGLLWGARKIVR